MTLRRRRCKTAKVISSKPCCLRSSSARSAVDMASRRRTSPAEADRGTSSSVERKRERERERKSKKVICYLFPPLFRARSYCPLDRPCSLLLLSPLFCSLSIKFTLDLLFRLLLPRRILLAATDFPRTRSTPVAALSSSQILKRKTMFAAFGFGGGGSTFSATYRVYPVSFLEKESAERGDKLILPPSALDRLGESKEEEFFFNAFSFCSVPCVFFRFLLCLCWLQTKGAHEEVEERSSAALRRKKRRKRQGGEERERRKRANILRRCLSLSLTFSRPLPPSKKNKK